MTSTTQALSSSQTLPALLTFLKQAHGYVPLQGGRRFSINNGQDSVCLNDMTRRLQELHRNTDPDQVLPIMREIMGEMHRITYEAKEQYDLAYRITQWLTIFRQWLGNRGYDRKLILSRFNAKIAFNEFQKDYFDINPDVLKAVLKQLTKGEAHECEFRWRDTEIFKHPAFQGYVFYVNLHLQSGNLERGCGNTLTKSLFSDMVKLNVAYRTYYPLKHVDVRPVKMFEIEVEGKTYNVIAQPKTPKPASEEIFFKHGAQLNEALKELVSIVAESGWHGMRWEDFAVVEKWDSSSKELVLVYPGATGNPARGIHDLIRLCVSEEQINLVISEARRMKIPLDDIQSSKTGGLKQLKSRKELHEFHELKGIKANPKKPIDVNLETLGLPLQETQDGFSMRTVALEVIKEINRQIRETDGRLIYLKIYDHLNPLFHYRTLGAEEPVIIRDEKTVWIHRIVTALIKEKHLFELISIGEAGYCIQA